MKQYTVTIVATFEVEDDCATGTTEEMAQALNNEFSEDDSIVFCNVRVVEETDS